MSVYGTGRVSKSIASLGSRFAMKSCAVFLFAWVVSLSGLSALGCANSASESGVFTPPPSGSTDIDDAGAPPDAMNEGRPPVSQIRGSPLCNASFWIGCYPDNPHGAGSGDCPNISAAGGFDNGQGACRVQPNGSDAGVAGPVCGLAGPSTEGMPCTGSADCAAGYECTSEAKCRAYCCAGQCSNQNSFCDIQPMLTYPTLKVPVCIPITPCGLLDSEGGTCPSSQTCAVVRENGATSCVAIGPRQLGDECNTDHCARGLVCLGTSGDLSCFQLCHTAMRTNECAATPQQICKGGSFSPVPGIGICQ